MFQGVSCKRARPCNSCPAPNISIPLVRFHLAVTFGSRAACCTRGILVSTYGTSLCFAEQPSVRIDRLLQKSGACVSVSMSMCVCVCMCMYPQKWDPCETFIVMNLDARSSRKNTSCEYLISSPLFHAHRPGHLLEREHRNAGHFCQEKRLLHLGSDGPGENLSPLQQAPRTGCHGEEHMVGWLTASVMTF